MKTGLLEAPPLTAAIVHLLNDGQGDARALDALHETAPAGSRSGPPADASTTDAAQLPRARAFAEPLLDRQQLDTGENVLAHADAVALILAGMGAGPALQAAAYLVYAGDYLARPDDVIRKAFGASHASLVAGTRKLVQIQRAARLSGADHAPPAQQPSQQIERLRKMLLAFSQDLRIVLLRLASRLQTLRYFAASKRPCPHALATETMQVFAPLANRLGIWQIKWELEDLAFRFLEPREYQRVARLLDERRLDREQRVEAFRRMLAEDLAAHGIAAQVQGRPKHLYSIWKKMQGKNLDFAQVLDLRAVRVIVEGADDTEAAKGTDGVAACYAVLGRVHARCLAVAGEFDDYIERPKANGYQSLHTVVLDAQGGAVEVQIRTRAMHDHAEQGVAAHWAYKDAGAKGYAGVQADATQQARIAEARKAVLRQLLDWERDAAGGASASGGRRTDDPQTEGATDRPDERIYVFTPAAGVVDLPAGATPIDFAYAVHTTLGHRCRGAKVDGAIVPLNTPLASGQTVEVIAVKEGGPSLDWLNPELGYLKSPRSRAKVRAWHNALAQRATVARGREAVEKLLQREGRTAMKLDDLAAQLGFRSADALFEVVGKDEFSLRNIENLLRPPEPVPSPDEVIALRRSKVDAPGPKGGVLVVGVESLMTSLARCCRPAPPDAIGGYVTRGKGVAVHRAGCSNFRHLAARSPERVIPVAWGTAFGERGLLYPVDIVVEASDRQGLLRDVSELFAKEKMNVSGVRTRSVQSSSGGTAFMNFTIEVADAVRLGHVLGLAARIAGVRSVRRK